MTSSTAASADAAGQSRLPKNSSHSICPIIEVEDDPSRSGMTNSPVIGMKQSSTPATMPGADGATVPEKSVPQGGARRSAAAPSTTAASADAAGQSRLPKNSSH